MFSKVSKDINDNKNMIKVFDQITLILIVMASLSFVSVFVIAIISFLS
ncbi:MAG: hypothetical protein ACXVHO_07715 [Methanobacterium sp.]